MDAVRGDETVTERSPVSMLNAAEMEGALADREPSRSNKSGGLVTMVLFRKTLAKNDVGSASSSSPS